MELFKEIESMTPSPFKGLPSETDLDDFDFAPLITSKKKSKSIFKKKEQTENQVSSLRKGDHTSRLLQASMWTTRPQLRTAY